MLKERPHFRSSARNQTDRFQESDLFDALAYIAYLRPPLKRAERADSRRESTLSSYEPSQRDFLDFVLSQYVDVGESELDTDKLPELLQLKYGTSSDAMKALGSVSDIRATFRGFQRGLYNAPELDRDLKINR